MHITGSGTVAHDKMQVKIFRRTSTSKDDNALHAVRLECKLAQGKTEAFALDVKVAPEWLFATVTGRYEISNVSAQIPMTSVLCVWTQHTT